MGIVGGPVGPSYLQQAACMCTQLAEKSMTWRTASSQSSRVEKQDGMLAVVFNSSV